MDFWGNVCNCLWGNEVDPDHQSIAVKAWHTYLDDPTLAYAILDRILHSSHCIALKGGTLRDTT
jgi:hypothetical protein